MADSGGGGGRGVSDLIIFVVVLALLGAFWLITGGPSRASSLGGPFLRPPAPLSTGEAYYLDSAEPWRKLTNTSFGVRAPIISSGNTAGTQNPYATEKNIEYELADIQKQVDNLSDEVTYRTVFGTPSPYRGKVSFDSDSAYTAKVASNRTEFVTIHANANNKTPVSITGWKIVSAIKNKDGSVREAYIGNASPLPVVGEVNPVYGVQLEPGGTAHITTGPSPFGVSFRVNKCSGYLGQFQEYTPKLARSCPKPIDDLRLIDNKVPYLNACDTYLQTLPRCTAFFKATPIEYGTECDQFIKRELTYNGCVDNHMYRPLFYTNEWRIFLNKQDELWRNKRDVIKLLDASGKTVDMISY
jgi:hypothetical protein